MIILLFIIVSILIIIFIKSCYSYPLDTIVVNKEINRAIKNNLRNTLNKYKIWYIIDYLLAVLCIWIDCNLLNIVFYIYTSYFIIKLIYNTILVKKLFSDIDKN